MRNDARRILATGLMLLTMGLVVPGCGGGGGGGGAVSGGGVSSAPAESGDEKKPVKPSPSPTATASPAPAPSPSPTASPAPAPSPSPSPSVGWASTEIVLNDAGSPPSQAGASLAMDSTGRLVAIWNTDADSAQVYGRLVSSAGKPNAAPFRVASSTASSPGLRPAATSHSSSGRFTALWTEPTAQPRILYRSFLVDPAATSPGAVISETVLASSDSTRSLRGASAAMDARGTVLSAWTAAGTPSAVTTRSVASGNETAASAAADVAADAHSGTAPAVGRDGAAAGSYAVAWLSAGSAGSTVQVRVFRGDGSPLSTVTPVTASSLRVGGPVGLAMDGSSAFVVTWVEDGTVMARPFQWTGSAVNAGAPVAVSAATRVQGFLPEPTMQGPSVALAPTSGTAVVTWAADHPTTGSLDVHARRFRISGGVTPTLTAVDAAEFVVPGTPAGMQYAPSAAVDGSGNFAVSWVDDAGRLVVRLMPNSFSGG